MCLSFIILLLDSFYQVNFQVLFKYLRVMYMTINVMYRETFYKLNFKNTRNIIKITEFPF